MTDDEFDKLDIYRPFGHPFFRDRFYPKLFNEMDKFMQEFFDLPQMTKEGYKFPKREWETQDTKYVGTIEVPGIDKDKIKMKVNGSGLEILAEQTEEKKDNKMTSKSSRKYFSREYLPEDSDIEKISAAYENGVLTITVPRVETKQKEKDREIKIE